MEDDDTDEWFDKDQPGSKGGGGLEDPVVKSLKRGSIIFVVVATLVVVGLGWLGWSEINRAINLQYPAPAPTLEATLAEATPAPTGAAAAGQATPTPAATPTPTLLPKQASASSSRQHFLTLLFLAAALILFPAALLLAFAIQRMPRQAKDLANDLKKLGQSYTQEAAQEWLSQKSSRKPPAGAQRSLAEDKKEKSIRSLAAGRGDVDQPPEDMWGPWISSRLEIRYGLVEYLLPLFIVTLFIFATSLWVFWPQGIYGFVTQMTQNGDITAYLAAIFTTSSPLAIAVLVGYLFMIYQLVRRYHRSDITPGGYWEVVKRLLVVFLMALALTVLIGANPDGASNARWLSILFAILVGVFPVGTLQILTRGIQAALQAWIQSWMSSDSEKEITWGAQLAQRLYSRHELSQLDDLDQWDVERIEEEGVIGLQGMAQADIVHLITWTPFPTSQIIDWVDQAILFLAAGAEPETTHAKTLRTLGLRGASDLIDAAADGPQDKPGESKERLVRAALTLQSAPSDDPMPLAQLAAFRAQLKVKEAQDKAARLKDKKENDTLDKTELTAMIKFVRDAKSLVDAAHAKVKAGGDALKDALDAADSLQAKFKTAGEQADTLEAKLKDLTGDKYNKDLADALKPLVQKLNDEPDANSQAKALSDALDKIDNPLQETEAKTKEFQEKAKAILQKAEAGAQTDTPAEVAEAVDLLTKLTELAQAAQKKIQADPSLEKTAAKAGELVKLLTDEADDKPKKLLGDDKLKKKDQWTAAGDDKKAKAFPDAQKLADQAGTLLTTVQDGAKALLADRAAAAAVATPVLTFEVLETILRGLERQNNLRRIQRYLTEESAEIPAPKPYKTNLDWLAQEK